MPRLLTFIVVLCVCRILSASAQIDPKIRTALMMSAPLGHEYWIAIPPNEINPYPTDELEVYVTSPFDTEIEVYDVADQRTYKRAIKAYEIRTLSDFRSETNWTWEVREAEKVVAKGIRIRSEHPLSVYVLNSKSASSDGYTAVPTRAWGTEYIAASYYDFREFKQWAGGFIVVAREDNTDITIRLRGTGVSDAKTSGGKSIGDSIRVILNEGDVYMVKGNGETRGTFDLTGSNITASKPIGLIGFHERTTMPNLLVQGNGRNHLCEMLLPVSSWSTSYSTVQFLRENRNNIGKGDVFRVIAAEPNTRWTLKYYDLKTKILLGEGGGVLTKAGEFADLTQASAPTTLTHGYSVWEADKPILVMQYSCSQTWDGDPILDPFMVALQPLEKFVQHSVIQAPTTLKFRKHRINLIVETDVNDPNLLQNLQSLKLDGVPVFNHPRAVESPLTSNRMANDLYWAILDVDTAGTAHTITGNGKIRFGGHVYGYGFVDAYGWPITGEATLTPDVDSMPPMMSGTQTPKPGTVVRAVSESQANASGLMMIALDSAASTNCVLTSLDTQIRPGSSIVTSSTVTISVVDCSRPARATWFASDWRGNISVDTFTYVPAPRFDKREPAIVAADSTRGSWNRTVTDSVTARRPATDCSDNIPGPDGGIRSIALNETLSTNVTLTVLAPISTDSLRPTRVARYTVSIVDSTLEAFAEVAISDWAGNTTTDRMSRVGAVSVLDAEEGASPIRVFREGTNTILRSDAAPMTSVSILDLRGRLVVSAQPGSDVWSGALPPGVYIALVVVDGRTLRLPLAAF